MTISLISDEKPNLIELENIESSTGQIISISSLDSQTSIKTKFKKNDVLFGKLRPYLKKFAYVEFSGVCSSEIWVLRGVKVSNLFLFYLIQTDSFLKLANQSTGSKMPRADWGIIRTALFDVPIKEEQQKIATFLSAVDEKISLLQHKLELLQTYKRGVMQKLFSQELRFKREDGSSFPDWNNYKIANLIEHIGGTALESLVNPMGSHKFISIGNYSTDGRYIDNGQRIFAQEKAANKLLSKNNLVMVLNDKTSSGDLIGSTILIDQDDEYVYNQRSERIICNSKLLPEFAWFFFNSFQFRHRVRKAAQGGTQIYINFSEVKKFVVTIPKLEEQQKIATFLSAIDSKIEALNKQISLTQDFKKGLLQQMFV